MQNDLYGISRWGENLIGILPNGNICLHDPLDENSEGVDLPAIIHSLQRRGINTPVLLRVSNFLEYKIRSINESFQNAIKENEYQGRYLGVSNQG